MADNFDLRQFLTENKLTKNAKLLKEADETTRAYALVIDEDGNFIQEDLRYYSEESYLDPEGIELSGVQEVLTYPETVSAWQHAPELKDSQDAQWKQAVAELGNSYTYYDVIGDGGENAVIAAIPQGSSLSDYIQDEEELDEAAPATMQAGFDMVNAEVKKHKHLMKIANELFPEHGGDLQNFRPLSQEERNQVYAQYTKELKEGVGVDGEEDYEDDDERANDIEQAQHDIERRYEEGVEEGTDYDPDNEEWESDDDYPGQTRYVSRRDIEEETVKENTMTQRDKYLTRLVENALGLNVTEDDNVDYTMGRQDDPNQLPNPASQISIPEGDEIAQKKPLPKYENIDNLMKEIEHGASKAVYEYKMKTMKEIADMLEEKATSLEEGEHAEYTDKKAINQMHKDIKKLRDGVAKLRKEFDKKFNKKAKSTAAEKEEKEEAPVTLAEGTFDLRKFLVENKITTNSRMLNELATAEDHIDRAAANQAIQKLNSMGARIDSMKGAELMKKLEATPYSQMFQVMAQYFEDHNALEKVKQYMAGEGYPV